MQIPGANNRLSRSVVVQFLRSWQIKQLDQKLEESNNVNQPITEQELKAGLKMYALESGIGKALTMINKTPNAGETIYQIKFTHGTIIQLDSQEHGRLHLYQKPAMN